MALAAFDEARLLTRLSALSPGGQRAFGALCCERLLPNYAAFQQETGWGDIHPLRYALDRVWLDISGRSTPSTEAGALAEVCEALAPSSDDFSQLRVTSAQDACFAICSLLDHLIDSSPEKILQVATYATDSVDLFVQEIEDMKPRDPDLENKILMHPLMQRDLASQDRDIESVERVFNSAGDAQSQLVALRRHEQGGSLDLGS